MIITQQSFRMRFTNLFLLIQNTTSRKCCLLSGTKIHIYANSKKEFFAFINIHTVLAGFQMKQTNKKNISLLNINYKSLTNMTNVTIRDSVKILKHNTFVKAKHVHFLF